MGDRTFGRLIRERRETLGLSQARLGELVGRSASTIRNWEREKSTPSARSDAVALAAVLGLNEAEVLERAGFEVGSDSHHETVEQAYASLAPNPTDGSDRISPVTERGAEEPGPSPADPSPDDDVVGWEEASQAPVEDSEGDEESSPLFELPIPRFRRRDPGSGRADPSPEPSRAAPPTVLEAAGAGEPSYVEDPDERQRYRTRALVTAAVVVFLGIVLIWSFGRATDAFASMWEEFVGMLEL